MSMFSIFGVSGSAISAQAQRLNVVASNLANADAVAGPDGQFYKARQVVFETLPFDEASQGAAGVKINAVTESQAPARRTYEPTHQPLQRQRSRGNGQHDLRLALLPEQRRGHEHRQDAAAQDAADGPVSCRLISDLNISIQRSTRWLP
jgi:flagellar basal body rod protein FlgB